MCTAFTHAFVAAAGGKMAFSRPMPLKFWLLAMFCAAAPDLDTGLHAYGVKYGDLWGHRGMTHSLLFALLLAVVVVSWLFRHEARWLSRRWFALVGFFFAATASHGVLDAFTDGGLGIAFFSPFDDARHFFPWTPIEVPPIGVRLMFTRGGAHVLMSELLWIWLPTTSLLAVVLATRWLLRRKGASSRAEPQGLQ